ncbi:hypothetical protein [Micromonospora zingiberis]|uniref:hypothetical protein n=1 Tax=Micromonospora zingiberis TaxID=2053011 RepID=UPI0013F3EE1E|nr:hypothetical protein [Micromonospora zingiberis]
MTAIDRHDPVHEALRGLAALGLLLLTCLALWALLAAVIAGLTWVLLQLTGAAL